MRRCIIKIWKGVVEVVSGGDPSVRRRKLGNAVRTLREARGLTQRQVAEELDWSLSKIIRVEAGAHGISVTDLDALLKLYEATDSDRVEELREAARQSRDQPWWHGYRDLVSPQFARYLSYEDDAKSFRISHSHLIPGLLHTSAYAEALLQVHSSDDRVRRIGELRARRQEHTLGQPGITHDFIVAEAALHQEIGGPRVLREQLQHLLKVGRKPDITIRVVPFSAGAHPGLRGPFNLIALQETDEEILYREGITGDRITRGDDDPEKIAMYSTYFEELCGQALPGGRGEDLLREQIERLGQIRLAGGPTRCASGVA